MEIIDNISDYIKSPEGKIRQQEYIDSLPESPSGIRKIDWHPFIVGITREFIAKDMREYDK